jgi:hypothetical protein
LRKLDGEKLYTNASQQVAQAKSEDGEDAEDKTYLQARARK